ncbi:MAG: BPSS1780 family membrane protein [Pseudomonadota bacterium]
MNFNRVDAGRGAGWYADGWNIVKGQLGMWLLLVVIYLGLAVVLSLIPMIGQLAFALISPALTAGLFLAAHRAGEGTPLDAKVLFQPLMDERTRGPMLTLGAISIGFSLVLVLTIVMLAGGAMGTSSMMEHDPQAMESSLQGLGMAGLLVVLALSLVFTMAMLYAAPLVLFGEQAPIESLKSSFRAVLSNWLPLLVFGLIFLPLAVIASLPLMLGWLFLLPIVIAALYASYRDIFGITRAPAQPEAAPTQMPM